MINRINKYIIIIALIFPHLTFATAKVYSVTVTDNHTKILQVQDISPIGTGDEDYGCAANAVTNLFGYWNDRGCDFFFDTASGTGIKLATDMVDAENVNRMLEELYADMRSFSVTFPIYGEQDLTASADIAPGIKAALSYYGITGTVTPKHFFSFDDVKNEIDSGRPCIVGVAPSFRSHFFIHYAVAIGYGLSEDAFTIPHRIIILDYMGITGQPFYIRGAGFGLNPLYLCTIEPECAEE